MSRKLPDLVIGHLVVEDLLVRACPLSLDKEPALVGMLERFHGKRLATRRVQAHSKLVIHVKQRLLVVLQGRKNGRVRRPRIGMGQRHDVAVDGVSLELNQLSPFLVHLVGSPKD